MRNLYKRLGIPESASKDQINQAIIRCKDRSLKLDAEAVLLNPRAKNLFDQTQKTLKGLTSLRKGLGLSHGSHWNSSFDSEFSTGAIHPLRANEYAFTKGPPPASRQAHTTKSDRYKQARDAQRSDNPYTTESTRPRNGTFRSNPKIKPEKKKDFSFGWIIAVGMFIAIIVIATIDSSNSGYEPTPNYERSQESAKPAFTAPPVQAPTHGAIARYHNSPAVAPLEIITSYGDYYFVKMVNKLTGSTEVELFIHGGNRIEINMPIGNYTMKYAVGSVWYGRVYNFGPETAYSMAESTFSFNEDSRGYSGYTVTLYKVAHGNMETTKIPASAF